MTDSGEWRPVPAELDIPGSVYESRISVTGAGTHPDTHISWEHLAATLASDYTYFADVSQFQGVPVNNTYPHPIFSFRICDGTYFDTLAERNWANAHALLTDPGHPLSLVWVYFFFRPGTWDSVASYIHRVFGSDKMPPNVAAMIDAEPWGGQVSGDHSYELNQWAMNLAGRTASGWSSIVGYSYTAGFQELWPRFDPRIKRHTASYGVWDPSPYGWQYSGGTGTGGLPGWPHGAGPWPLCDMNVIKKPISTILEDFGYGDDMATVIWTEAQQTEIYNILHTLDFGTNNGGSTPYSQRGEITDRLRAIDANTVGLEAKIDALPTAAEVADAVLAAGGGGGLTRAQLIDVLNQTGLKVSEPQNAAALTRKPLEA